MKEGVRAVDPRNTPDEMFELWSIPAFDNVRPSIKGSDIWKRIMRNQDERHYYFPQIAQTQDLSGESICGIIADFKRIFSIPKEEFYARLGNTTRRRCVLETPFLQAFGNRFGFYMARIALPEMDAPPQQQVALSPLTTLPAGG